MRFGRGEVNGRAPLKSGRFSPGKTANAGFLICDRVIVFQGVTQVGYYSDLERLRLPDRFFGSLS